MADLVSSDKLLYDNNFEVDGRNRARIIRRCQELERDVYLDFGRSSKLDCVIGVWDDEDGNKLTEKFGTHSGRSKKVSPSLPMRLALTP